MSEPRGKLVYILAASHSGSTLLALLLGAHPDICTVGELKIGSLGDAERYLCSCRTRLRECIFWRRVSDEMAARGFEFHADAAGTDLTTGASRYEQMLLKPLCRGPAPERLRDALLSLSPHWRSRLTRLQARNAALVRSVLTVSGAGIIVDSSKTGLRLKYLQRNPELDVKVIRLVRDGRGVALTYMQPGEFADASDPRLRGGGSGRSSRAPEMPMQDAAHLWRRSNEEAEAVLKNVAREAQTCVSYEHLCLETDRELDRLFDFIGVDPARRVEDFRDVEQHVVGNGMRLDSSSSVTLDERWKERLTNEELTSFDRVAGPLNRSLGYV